MTLESLIATLAGMPPTALVKIGGGGNAAPLDSYRGYYDQLAIGTCSHERTVADVLDDAREALAGKVFEGYKGGSFTMHAHTPVWASEYGEWSSNAIVGVALEDGVVHLTVVNIVDYA